MLRGWCEQHDETDGGDEVPTAAHCHGRGRTGESGRKAPRLVGPPGPEDLHEFGPLPLPAGRPAGSATGRHPVRRGAAGGGSTHPSPPHPAGCVLRLFQVTEVAADTPTFSLCSHRTGSVSLHVHRHIRATYLNIKDTAVGRSVLICLAYKLNCGQESF